MTLPERLQLDYDDLRSMPEDGRRHEILGGKHFVTPAPRLRHQALVSLLDARLGEHARQHRLGQVFPAPVDVVLTPVDVVQPDLVFISRARAEILSETAVHGAPDLVVEVLSASTRRVDEVLKRKLYEQHGVQEYWTVDPDLDTLRLRRNSSEPGGPNGFGQHLDLSAEAGDQLETSLLPDLRLDLRELFETF